MSIEILTWKSEKPTFTEEGVFVSASWWGNHWDYSLWQAIWRDGANGDYLSLCDGDGHEYGDWEDLTADRYLVLPTPERPIKLEAK